MDLNVTRALSKLFTHGLEDAVHYEDAFVVSVSSQIVRETPVREVVEKEPTIGYPEDFIGTISPYVPAEDPIDFHEIVNETADASSVADQTPTLSLSTPSSLGLVDVAGSIAFVASINSLVDREVAILEDGSIDFVDVQRDVQAQVAKETLSPNLPKEKVVQVATVSDSKLDAYETLEDASFLGGIFDRASVHSDLDGDLVEIVEEIVHDTTKETIA